MSKRRPNGQFAMDSGMHIDSKGYPRLSCGPLRGMRIHVLVAIAKFGAKLVFARDRVIHHKDNNKLNPHPDNLQLMTVREHNAVSAKQYWFLKTYIWPKEKKAWDDYFASEKVESTE